jgi:hypothetical protein
MPVEWDVADSILSLRLTGNYETRDVRAAVLAALDDPRALDVKGMLFDVSESESLKERYAVDVIDMGNFLASHQRRFNNRIALVAASDFRYGMMRLGSATLQTQAVVNRVFRNEAEARAWLIEGKDGE